MANPKPWLKMWSEWPNDPKMVKLNLTEIGAWWELVTLAHNCNNEGRLTTGNGSGLTISDIITNCRIAGSYDRRCLTSMLKKMEHNGSLHWEDDILVVTNYKTRQEKVPSESKEAVRDRVQAWRLKKRREAQGTLPLDNPPPLDKDGDIDTEGEGECNGVTPVTSGPEATPNLCLDVTGKSLHNDLETNRLGSKDEQMHDEIETMMAVISNIYEENIGPLKPVLREEFNDFIESFRGPAAWIPLAFKEALSYNKRNWKYIRTILEDWEEKGGPDDKSKQPRAKRTERADTSKRRPLEGARETGWDIVGNEGASPGDGD